MTIHVYIGVVGSGKDYQSQQCVKANSGKHVAFADGVREDIWKLIGFKPKNEKEYEAFKKHVFVNVDGSTYIGRDLLTRYGTDIRRHEDEDVWCKRTLKAIEAYWKQGVKHIAISDCRFINEVEYLKKLEVDRKVKTVFHFCNYKSERYDDNFDHESERLAQYFTHVYKCTDMDERFNNFIHEVDLRILQNSIYERQ